MFEHNADEKSTSALPSERNALLFDCSKEEMNKYRMNIIKGSVHCHSGFSSTGWFTRHRKDGGTGPFFFCCPVDALLTNHGCVWEAPQHPLCSPFFRGHVRVGNKLHRVTELLNYKYNNIYNIIYIIYFIPRFKLLTFFASSTGHGPLLPSAAMQWMRLMLWSLFAHAGAGAMNVHCPEEGRFEKSGRFPRP